MKSINPATNDEIKTYSEHTEQEAVTAVENADTAFADWRRTDFAHRATILNRAADELERRKLDLAKLMAREMGKPLSEGESEVDKCAWVCRYYADNGAKQLADQHIDTDFLISKVAFQPLGCVFAVMPWNYPLWQVFRFAAPTLMAGNVALLKHAENVSGCALEIESVFRAAGIADHIFTTLLIDKDKAKAVIEHPLVRAVTLTGSTRAGKSVAATAGGVLKKCVLELGGSDAYLVLSDADVDHAVKKCAQSRLLNGGQSCISAKRFLVHSDIIDEFESKLVKAFKNHVVGDPMHPDTTIGPMARADLRDQLHDQVTESIDAGARCVLGGKVPEGKGAYYPPTVLVNVKPGMAAFDEELFGPVAALIEIKSTEHAIELANQSDYGLGGAVFSNDLASAEDIATRRVDSGACFVNDFVKSDPRLPFGGVKQSGYGRELGEFGIHEFVNIKTVCVEKAKS